MTDLEYHNREGHTSYIGITEDGRLTLRCEHCTYETNNLDEVRVRVITFHRIPANNDNNLLHGDMNENRY